MFYCKVKLKWDDRMTPMLSAQGEAKTKKIAKRKSLSQLVDLLISQGFIYRGFK